MAASVTPKPPPTSTTWRYRLQSELSLALLDDPVDRQAAEDPMKNGSIRPCRSS
jgi:hypothetical protein